MRDLSRKGGNIRQEEREVVERMEIIMKEAIIEECADDKETPHENLIYPRRELIHTICRPALRC